MRPLQAFVLRTGRGPLGWLWRAAYAGLAHAIAACLRHGNADTSVYVGGSFGFGEPVPGLSDLDLFAVSSADPALIRRRWARIMGRLPALRHVATDVYIYGDAELRRALSPAPVSDRTFVRHDDLHDDGGLGVRPGPFGATRGWRLLAGRERRPDLALDEQSRRLAAWLELQFWWRFAFQGAAAPTAPWMPFLCVKLIAEPARLWLWLVEGREVFGRRQVLREAMASLPREGAAFALALDVERRLPHRPEAPLATALASFTRQSAVLAGLMNDAAARAGADDVLLVGADEGPPVLADWRALVAPGAAGNRFEVVDGEPADPALLARLGAALHDPSPALHSGPLLVRPANTPPRAKLRAVQCAATDPVSFAQIDGEEIARFPRLAGWRAADWARRAVDEHRTWLHHPRTGLNGYGWLGAPTERERLITAGRAALFAQSIDRGRPALVLSSEAVCERLGADAHDIAALRRVVGGLEAYG